jgi:hypothetical protein
MAETLETNKPETLGRSENTGSLGRLIGRQTAEVESELLSFVRVDLKGWRLE